MADNQNTELRLVLTLDGKPFDASIKTSQANAQKFIVSLENVAITSAKVVKENTALTGSVDDLTYRLQTARTEFNALPPSSAKYENALKRVNNLQNLLSRSTRSGAADLHKYGAASGQTGFAVLNMNRVISDAPFGFIAISNNIEPLIQSMQMVTARAGGFKAGMVEMAKSMIGPLGLMTAISLVTSALTYFAMSNRSAAKESDDLAKKSNDLSARIRSFAASYKDLAEGNKLYREELRKTGIAEKEAELARLKNDLSAGGKTRVVKGEPVYYPFSNSEKDAIKKNIAEVTTEIDKYYANLRNGSPAVNYNIKLLNQLTAAALESGESGIVQFIKNTSVSEKQFENLISQLKKYESTAFGVFGGKAKGTDILGLEISGKLKPVKEDIESAIELLDKFYNKYSGKTEKGTVFAFGSIGFVEKEISKLNEELKKTTSEDTRIELRAEIKAKELKLEKLVAPTVPVKFDSLEGLDEDAEQIEKIERALTELSLIVEGIKELPDALKSETAAADIDFLNSSLQEYNAGLIDVETLMQRIENIQLKTNDATAARSKSLDEQTKKAEALARKEARFAEQRLDAYHNLGNVISQISGQQESLLSKLGSLLQTIVEVYGTIGAMERGDTDSTAGGIDILSSVLGFVGLFHGGGIAGSPNKKVAVNPAMFKNAEVYHTGGIAGVPAILDPGELIITENMQKNLLGMLATNQTYSKINQSMDLKIKLEGSLRSNKNDFVAEFEKAKKDVISRLGVGGVNVFVS